MHLTHPIAPYQGIPAEDCVFVTNDRMMEMGMGYVTMFTQGEMYPEAPLHIYLQIDAQPAGRNLLLGALLARAEQLRAQTPHLKGRIYAQLTPEDWDMTNFYTKAGFKMDDSEELYRFPLPEWPARAPVSCNFSQVAMRTPQETMAFMNRFNAYRIAPIDTEFLTRCMQMEHFMAIGFYRGNHPVCEALFTGQGTEATLVGLYVRADYRRQGFAKAIIGAACDILRERGVMQITTRAFSRNAAQMGLMRAAGAKKVKTTAVLPGLPL